MVSDFGAWAFLLSNMRGYSAERSKWNTIRPINPSFPDGSIVFGDAGCDRLVLPFPTPFEAELDPSISARNFRTDCSVSLQSMAQQLQPGDKLILLLIGHGSFEADGFCLLI